MLWLSQRRTIIIWVVNSTEENGSIYLMHHVHCQVCLFSKQFSYIILRLLREQYYMHLIGYNKPRSLHNFAINIAITHNYSQWIYEQENYRISWNWKKNDWTPGDTKRKSSTIRYGLRNRVIMLMVKDQWHSQTMANSRDWTEEKNNLIIHCS